MSEGPSIFVSHCREDDAFCQRLITDLRVTLGAEAIWYDTSEYNVNATLHGSEDWWDRILAEITARPYFLVILSPHAAASRWAPQEMKIAYRQHMELGKTLLPVRLAESERREDWKSIQEFDFTRWEDPERYATALAALLHAVGVATVTPTPLNPSLAPVSSAIAAQAAKPIPSSALALHLTALERLEQETHTAYGRERWSDVLDKTDILLERGAMTPSLWRERASADLALKNALAGLAAADAALQADPDDADLLLRSGRLAVMAGKEAQAATAFTLAYALSPLDTIAKRLVILDELTAALVRLGRWDEYNHRVEDARRLAPEEPTWRLRQIKGLLGAHRYEEAIDAIHRMPPGAGRIAVTTLEPAWRAAIAEAQRAKNWSAWCALLDAAPAVGADQATIACWRQIEFPHNLPVMTLTGHSGMVSGVAWSPDGARLVTASNDNTARIWNAASRQTLVALIGHRDKVRSVTWSPDGARLATTSDDNTARIWRVSTGQALATLRHGSSVSSVAWSPGGGRLATGSYDQTARIWEVTSGQTLATLRHGGSVHSVLWSPDGAHLATTSDDNMAHIWKAATRRLLTKLTNITSVAWSPDGGRLAAGSYDQTARIWEVTSGQLLVALTGHNGRVGSVAWSPDGGRLATGSYDRTVQVWEAASGRLLVTLTGHSGIILSVAWSPDGARLATASSDKTVRVWEAATGRLLTTLASALSVAWSPDGARLATTSDDNTAWVWEAE
jgi:WD40 repeat protein